MYYLCAVLKIIQLLISKIFKCMEKKNIIKAVAYLLTALATALLIAFGLSSCQVTRTITNEATSIQKGDTSVLIQTKTIESYNANKYELKK